MFSLISERKSLQLKASAFIKHQHPTLSFIISFVPAPLIRYSSLDQPQSC